MRRVLIVFLKDTFYTGQPGQGSVANWHTPPALQEAELEVVILGSGMLAVFMPDDVNGKPNQHLGGRRTQDIAVFPPGGWSGYTWEFIDEGVMAMAAAQARGIAVPR